MDHTGETILRLRSENKALHDEVRLLRDAIDKSNEALKVAVDLKEERDELLLVVKQLSKRTSAVTEPCACPEFCSYHARIVFDSDKEHIRNLKSLLEKMLFLQDQIVSSMASLLPSETIKNWNEATTSLRNTFGILNAKAEGKNV